MPGCPQQRQRTTEEMASSGLAVPLLEMEYIEEEIVGYGLSSQDSWEPDPDDACHGYNEVMN